MLGQKLAAATTTTAYWGYRELSNNELAIVSGGDGDCDASSSSCGPSSGPSTTGATATLSVGGYAGAPVSVLPSVKTVAVGSAVTGHGV